MPGTREILSYPPICRLPSGEGFHTGILSSTVQHDRCSAPPRTAICRFIPNLGYSCSFSMHPAMQKLMVHKSFQWRC